MLQSFKYFLFLLIREKMCKPSVTRSLSNEKLYAFLYFDWLTNKEKNGTWCPPQKSMFNFTIMSIMT